MMWLVLLSLLASASSTETDAASDIKTVQTQSRGVNMTFFVNTLNQVVSSLPVEDNKPVSGINSEILHAQIQEIAAMLNKTSSTDDVHEALDKISVLQEYVKTEFERLNFEGALLKDNLEDVNGSVSSLGQYTTQRLSGIANHISDIKISLQKTGDHLTQLALRLDRMREIIMKLASQNERERDVISSPHAYVVHVRNQSVSAYSENHHCLLELEGWGYEDPGYTRHKPYIRMNGRIVALPARRGVLIITLKLKNHGCTLWTTKAYDTYHSESEATALDALLKGLPSGTGIAVVTNDEFIRHFRRPAETLRKHYGIQLNTANDDKSIWLRSAAAWFAVKGDTSRARVKQLPRKKGPAKLFLDMMDGKFSPWGKGFIKFPSTMFVADKFTMVTAASGSDHDCITRCAVSRGCKTVNVLDQGGQTMCQMFTARGGYPGAQVKAAENSTMYELEYIP